MSTTSSTHGSETVSFRLHSNLIIIDVLINGASRPFVLDTGASATVIDQRTAEELQLPDADKMEEAHAVGCGPERTAVRFVRVDSLSVGGIHLSGLECGALSLGAICDKIGSEIAGVLGYDFLSRFKTTIDYREKRLTFESHEPANQAA